MRTCVRGRAGLALHSLRRALDPQVLIRRPDLAEDGHMKRRCLRAVVAATFVAALSACGGGAGSEISLSEWADRYDTLCRHVWDDALTLKAQLETASSPEDVAKYFSAEAELFRKANRTMRGLSIPTEKRTETKRLMALDEELVGVMEGLTDALRKRDRAAFEAVGARYDQIQVEEVRLEREIGADACAALSDETGPTAV